MKDAINLPHYQALLEEFPVTTGMESTNTIFIFYCEFSSQRAPRLLKELMKLDKMSDNSYYIYKNVYLMQYGFSKAYNDNHPLCCGSYIQMVDQNYEERYAYENQIYSLSFPLQRNRSFSPFSVPTTLHRQSSCILNLSLQE